MDYTSKVSVGIQSDNTINLGFYNDKEWAFYNLSLEQVKFILKEMGFTLQQVEEKLAPVPSEPPPAPWSETVDNQ